MEANTDTNVVEKAPKSVPENMICSVSVLANSTVGEVRCPVCAHLVPPEHIGYKLYCRRCGYLESCCNPV